EGQRLRRAIHPDRAARVLEPDHDSRTTPSRVGAFNLRRPLQPRAPASRTWSPTAERLAADSHRSLEHDRAPRSTWWAPPRVLPEGRVATFHWICLLEAAGRRCQHSIA